MKLDSNYFNLLQTVQLGRPHFSAVKYQLANRALHLGSALYLLARSVVEAALGTWGVLAGWMSRQGTSLWASERWKGSLAAAFLSRSYFAAIWNPNQLEANLIKSPIGHIVRETRMRFGDALIQSKLAKELQCAQDQMTHEKDGADFKYLAGDVGDTESLKVGSRDVGISHFIGRRKEMEDEHLTTSFDLTIQGQRYPVALFGIFDGHGGKSAARFLKDHLSAQIRKTLETLNRNGLTDEGIWNAFKLSFVRLNQAFTGDSGSTAVVCMIVDGKLWTANLGDSRAVLVKGPSEIIQLSEDAEPENPRYIKSIQNRGGDVFKPHFFSPIRVNGQIAVARAFGDHPVGPGMSARPKITAIPLKEIDPESLLVLGCDGIYDVASTRQVGTALQQNRSKAPSILARNLVFSAFQAGSQDNLSAMAVKL